MPLPIINAMEAAHRDGWALTFPDVRLKTGYSEVMPRGVELESRFTRKVPLKVPIVSAAMDTVTEMDTAIAMAQLGGLGVLHRNLSDRELLRQFYRVKFNLHGRIRTPITIKPDQTVAEVLDMMKRERYEFHTFPVVDSKDGKLVGIVGGDDFDFCQDTTSPVSSIMTREIVSAGPGISAEQAYALMIQNKRKTIPLIDSDEKLVGMYVWKDVKRIVKGETKRYNLDDSGRLRVGIAVGIRDDIEEFLGPFVEHGLDVAVHQSAHAATKSMLDTLERIKRAYPNLEVAVGNVSEPEDAVRLADNGADGILVGQGGGSICTTRVVAGVGCPQVTVVYNCTRALEKAGHDVPVCSDGGIEYSGDIPIAIGAGAESVMVGKLLAGTEEAPGEKITIGGRQFKVYRGMGSEAAMKAHAASRERYRQNDNGPDKLVPEGIEGAVPIRGKLEDVLYQYTGGLRAGMGYVGARTIQELREKAKFHRTTSAGTQENHPHGVLMTREPPNYASRGEK